MGWRFLTGGFKLGNRRWYPWLFAILCGVLVATGHFVGEVNLKSEWVIAAVGAAGGVTTFLYSQHLQETRLFADLFKQFNERYDGFNAKLNHVVENAKSPIRGDDLQCLMDYFNLCAEEYLYFKAGYIDETVWQSWVCGMRFFADVPAIRSIWEREILGGSYYGFTLDQVEAG